MTTDKLREQEAQKRYSTRYGLLGERDRERIDGIVEEEERQRRAVNPIGPKSGLTKEQLVYVGDAVYDAISQVLPKLVGRLVSNALPPLVQPLIERAVATSEANTAASVQAAVTAAETAAAAIGKAQGATPDSHERRLERHADHLAALETRVKKLERT